MSAKWPFGQMPKGSRIDNDANHGRLDPNSGGGPSIANRKRVPDAHRGGPYQSGQKQYARAPIHGGRGSAGNPVNRGGFTGEGRGGAATAETRVPGHGGAPQVRPMTVQRQFGKDGKADVVNQYPHARPKPGAGNLSGKMAKRITGRFNNSSKGPKAGGNVGSYGDRAPITSNT